MFRDLGWTSVMVVDDQPGEEMGVDPTLCRVSSTIQRVLTINVLGLNCYDALHFDMMVMSTAALESLVSRYERYYRLV